MPEQNLTKIQQYLKSYNLTQTDLYNLCADKFEKPIGADRISRFCNGGDCMLSTLIKFCIALECTLNDIVDVKEYAGVTEQ